ncbi:MAG: hypothetical protein EBS42_11565 [Caulobacteraceae bacterium]|jgi:hypothetical protein|nr:hypothetical protein [Caulobacteraceae bacterium]
MIKTINRLKFLFLGLFAIGVVAVWTYQIFWVWPAKTCERQQRWWDPATRACAIPIYIPDITGRPPGMSRQEWSEKQAARKIMEERYGAGVPLPAEAAPAAKAAAPAKAAAAPATDPAD